MAITGGGKYGKPEVFQAWRGCFVIPAKRYFPRPFSAGEGKVPKTISRDFETIVKEKKNN